MSEAFPELAVADRDPQAMFDASTARYLEALPAARVRNGSWAAILFEAATTYAADVIYAINRVIPVVLDAELALFGIPRDLGQPATGHVRLTLDGVHAPTIPAGIHLTETTTGIQLIVTETTVPMGTGEVIVPVSTIETGSAGNTLPADALLSMDDSISYVNVAALDGTLTGGADAESDAAYRLRASNRFAQLNSALSLPASFAAAALEDPRVGKAIGLRRTKPGEPIDTIDGHVTVVVYGRTGPLDDAVHEEIRARLHARASSQTTVHITAPEIIATDITATVKALAGVDHTELASTVETVLRGWMSPAAWTFGEDIRGTDIAVRIATVPGVDYVEPGTITPAGTIAIPESSLATAGDITITVT